MYRVEWVRSARDELAQLWVEATDRQAITEAADELDRELAVHPRSVGESRTPPFRLTFHGPIAVLFGVSEADRTVTVLGVKPARRFS